MVTIIIPVYNVQDYLARCLDSVVTQTYSDLEIILVDDGSTDDSPSICDSYAERDSRIKVIHKSNGGLSSARNAGLDIMSGDYVTFIDSDDFIHPDYVKTFMRLADRAPIIIGTWQELNEEKREKPTIISPIFGDVISLTSDEAICRIFYQQDINHSACCKMFDAKLFKTLRFPEGMLYEDLAISYELYKQVSKVVVASTPPIYYYMHRSGSIINTMTLERTHVLDHLDRIERQVSQEAPQYLPAVHSRMLSASFNMLRLLPDDSPQWKEVKDRCWTTIKRYRTKSLFDSRMRFKNKSACLASFLGKKILFKIINKR